MMKRLTITLFCLALLVCNIPSRAAISLSDVRQNARFLSDRMAYELNLNPNQYVDVFEINYDFLSGIRIIIDGVVRGNAYSIDRYYEYLDMRNEDLSYVLSRRQYLEFVDKDYFYRPVYSERSSWRLRIFTIYTNPTYFYFSIPVNFYTYNGIHNRSHYQRGFYNGRYHHEMYRGPLCRIRDHKSYNDHCWHDFKVRSDRTPSRYEPVRPGRYDQPPRHNNAGGRPDVRPDRGDRPNGHSGIQNRPNQGNRPGGNARPNAQIRPDKNGRPGGQVVNRPNQQQNRPNGNARPNQGGSKPNSGNRPDGNSRPNRNDNHSGQQARPNGTSRTVQVNYQPDKEKAGNASSGRDVKRNQSGGSRR